MKFDIFVHSVSVTKDLLDELGHANYNALKKVFEDGRLRLCRHLGFSRKQLRKHLGLGLFMVKDTYEYHHALKLGDVISLQFDVEAKGASMIITLKVLRVCHADSELFAFATTNTVIYEMVMVNLKKEKPVRIPKPILESIARWKEMKRVLATM